MLYDVTNYLLFSNPVSRGVGNGAWNLGKMAVRIFRDTYNKKHDQYVSFALSLWIQGLVAVDPPPATIVRYAPLPSMSTLIGGRFVYIRIGALSGAAAIAMNLYFTNRKHQELRRKDYRLEDLDVEQQRMFDTTNLFHFVHSVVLLSVPLMRMPFFVSLSSSASYSLRNSFYSFLISIERPARC